MSGGERFNAHSDGPSMQILVVKLILLDVKNGLYNS